MKPCYHILSVQWLHHVIRISSCLSVASLCPDGFQRPPSLTSCYQFVRMRRSHREAESQCSKLFPGAHLVNLESKDEYNWVVEHLKSASGKWQEPPLLTYLLLLISTLWHMQAIFESKGDKLSSSAECRIWTQGLRHLFASRLNACWQTDWAIEDQAKNLNSTARPYDQQAFSPLDPTASWLSHLALVIYMFVVVNVTTQGCWWPLPGCHMCAWLALMSYEKGRWVYDGLALIGDIFMWQIG